ncbi:hypothetical protein HYX04_03265 [Candidatus Woesearchaeota archaeon]|nr:hypothetical protein [Candidatus Woesearchaeota archaeon]
MKIILLDTNIYGLALEKKDVAKILISFADEKLKPQKEYAVLGSEIINDEINANPNREAVTDNRKTMMNPKAIEVFTLIDKKNGLRTPKFIGHEALKSFLLGSGVS